MTQNPIDSKDWISQKTWYKKSKTDDPKPQIPNGWVLWPVKDRASKLEGWASVGGRLM